MTTYKEAGVDIEKKNELLKKIKEHVKKTFFPDRVFFSNTLFKSLLFNASDLKNYEEPMLAFNVDGAGTKTMVAAMCGEWEGIGHDIVNHCVNDILTMGAKPLCFSDYIASDRLNPEVVEKIVKGVSDACNEHLIVFTGGETAEMPSVYVEGETDVAGFVVGVVDKKHAIDGRSIKEGDVLIGLASTGLHTNGFSLARKILFENKGYGVNELFPEVGMKLGPALLVPHRSYYNITTDILGKVAHSTGKWNVIKGIAHITGGSFRKNLPRILPKGLAARIERRSWKPLPIFNFIQEEGNVPLEEMYNTFNMGIGYVYVVDKSHADLVIKLLNDLETKYEKHIYQHDDLHLDDLFHKNGLVWKIGRVVKGKGVRFVD